MDTLTRGPDRAPRGTSAPQTNGAAPRTPAMSVRDTFTTLIGNHGSMARNVKVLLFTVDLTPDALRAWLPPGLKPPPRPRAHFWIGDYDKHSSGVAYREAAIMVEALWRGRIVSHCPWAVVDDEAPLIWGRDMMGYPKKMGTIDIARDGDAFEVEVRRRGERLWRVTGEVDSATHLDLGNFPFPTEVVNVWGIPFTPAILVKYDNTHDLKYLHPISANLEISGGTYDPLESLNVTNQAVTGRAFRTDLVLPQATRLPYWLWGIVGIMRPVGFTSPTWLLRHYLFRSL